MELTLTSWNGDTRINDGTNFRAIVIPGSLFDLTNQAVYVDRAENFPYLSGMVLPAHSFTFQILLPNSNTAHFIATQRELLKSIFNVTDFTPHNLIGTDENGKQWQLTGFPVKLSLDPKVKVDTAFLITIATAEPVWQAVTPITDTWNITATGQQRTITPAGNLLTRPVFAITPTVNRITTWQYFRWIALRNPSVNGLVNYPVEVTNGGINTAALVNFTAVSNQINQIGGIGAADVTIPINVPVGGGLPVSGMGFVDTEQIAWTNNTGGTQLTGVTRGIGGTTAAAHANGAVIALSKVLANGDDLRVVIDGQMVNRWLDGMNTATTKVWANGNWLAGATTFAFLSTALPNSGTAVTVQFAKTTATLRFLYGIKAARSNVFLIDTEAFTFNPANIDFANFQITNVNRAQKYTSFAAHAAAATAFWLEHDIYLLYGNAVSGPLDLDNTQLPLLDLHNSTNTSWVQTQFFDNTSARPAAWAGSVVTSRGKSSQVFTGNQTASANPSTELGDSLIDYQLANVWKSETATIQWLFTHPCGITTVSMAGQKYALAVGTWPTTAGLQKSNDGLNWIGVWNEAVPTLANTWQAFTHNAVALGGTFTILRLILSGTIAALANNSASIQGDTVTLALTNTPVITVSAELNAGSYYLNATITNTTTGDAITITCPLPLNSTLTIDTRFKTVTLTDGTNLITALTPSTVRMDWLNLKAGANLLQFDDPGTAGITIVTTFQERTI